jgi:ribosomal protein L14E/L6E/L27E
MGKIMKSGRVALILGGRYAGRKGVVVKVNNFLIQKQQKYKTRRIPF